MTHPRRPRRPSRPPGDGPVPRPFRPPTPTTPTTPFGPGDNATPDVQRILRQAAKTREALEAAQVELTRERHGPGPDGTPPRVRDVSRADGLWPYLVIRSQAGDAGARPLQPSVIALLEVGSFWSPDILLTPVGPPGEQPVVDREGYATLQARFVWSIVRGSSYDIWVHVWNLGRSPAYGVRVRAFLDPIGVFLGGRQLDLGDRVSPTSHRVIKVGTYNAGANGETDGILVATAECMSDVASGDRSIGTDRHTAHRKVQVTIPF